MVWMAVSLKIILSFFPILFLCLMIFRAPSFSDEEGPYAEFQRPLSTDFLPEFGTVSPSSLLLHMWYFLLS